MQYFTAYYRQTDAESSVSVLLQQAYHKKRKLPVILTCVSMDGDTKCGKRILRALADWFYGSALYLCGRFGERGMDMAADSLRKLLCELLREEEELADCSWTGALCVGEKILLFRRGMAPVRLLNTRVHRPYCHELKLGEKGEEADFWLGTIQRGAGILLATEAFCNGLPVRKMEECLNVQEIRSQSQAERRLKELGGCSETRDGRKQAAILIVAG